MKITVLGGGPGGLYASLLIKKAHPAWEIELLERNPQGATYGWGVVFSDQTLSALREADIKSYQEITESFVLWDAIDVHIRDKVVHCGGHLFAGMARQRLLDILHARCAELGVALRYEVEVAPEQLPELARGADLLIAADGINSRSREHFAQAFQPQLDEGATRYIWFGSDWVLDAFTFIFRKNEHGLFTAHAYPFDGTTSTFIVECTEETWRRAGLDQMDEAESLAYCEALFADKLAGHRLLSNYSRWFTFTTVRNRRWAHQNIVLLGDAAHTAHFSIGSGTKLAMEDAIALATAFEQYGGHLRPALKRYEEARRPRVEALQQAAEESQRYFEHIQRYWHFDPLQFTYYLLTRSGRISHNNLSLRDPYFTSEVERFFRTGGQPAALHLASPPLFTPLTLREQRLPNRVVLLPPPSDQAEGGMPHPSQTEPLVRGAQGGMGLVLTPPVAVSEGGRITPGCAGLYEAAHQAAWGEVAEAVHQAGGKVGLTLSHAGRRGATRPRQYGLDQPLRSGGWPLLAPSALPYSPASQTPQAMGPEEMAAVQADFVRATRWAAEADIDLLQLHMAHGYLLASFLSPLSNQREDEYGGTLEGRLRYPLALFDAVRAAWPAGRPLAVALSVSDWARGGFDLPDALAVARTLKAHGCDLITVMAGQTTIHAQPRYDAATYAAYSDMVRNEAHIPTLSTGYLSTTDPINTLLAGGRADLCLLHPLR